ncbi:MAG TPA: maleylacetoacetate isomerase [Polyangiaceae bacterium]|jgi:maleylacetoacetate isomerase
MPQLTLYNYWRSSSSHRVRIALGLKGLDYRYEVVNILAEEHETPAHRARSPMGYVPCLAVDGVVYVESVAIIELLEELYPAPPLYPGKPHARARIRALIEIVNSGIQPLQNRHVTQFLSTEADVQRRWLKHFVTRGLAALESAMATLETEGIVGRYAFGDSPSAADAFLVPQVDSARRFHVEVEAYPRIARAYDEAMKIEAFQKAAPARQPDAVVKS